MMTNPVISLVSLLQYTAGLYNAVMYEFDHKRRLKQKKDCKIHEANKVMMVRSDN